MEHSHFAMWPRFGIKVGNTTLCIAYVKPDGKPEVIANNEGDRVSQACLVWNESNEIECGLTAQQKMQTCPNQAVANSFQLFPTERLSEDKLSAALMDVPCEFDNLSYAFQLQCSLKSIKTQPQKNIYKLTPFEAQVKLLRSQLELARQYLAHPAQKPIAVVSIPSHYPQKSWAQLARAGEEAGFHIAQVIAEPTAAVLAYGIGEAGFEEGSSDTKHVVTVKSGGLFSHFALYSVQNGLYERLDDFGPFPIGGRQFTDALIDFICDEFRKKHKLDPKESRRAMTKIRNAAISGKHILTTLPSTQMHIESVMDGIDYSVQMSRPRYESIMQPVINKFMETLMQCLERAKHHCPEFNKVDAIVLLGATMRIPKLQAVLAARFPEAQLHCIISADEVVAIGCARQATFLINPKEQDLEAINDCVCIGEDLLIWHGNDEANAQILAKKGTVLPKEVRLEVKLSEYDEETAFFKLRAGGNVKTVYIKDATPEDGVFRLEAHIECEVGDEASAVLPVVKLRCF